MLSPPGYNLVDRSTGVGLTVNTITYFILHVAPSSSPSSVTVLVANTFICATNVNVTVKWTYDTSDADGYVVYYNDMAKLVEGGDVKETTLDGLIPETSYFITVRAYQDILGPPSDTIIISETIDKGNIF